MNDITWPYFQQLEKMECLGVEISPLVRLHSMKEKLNEFSMELNSNMKDVSFLKEFQGYLP